MDGTTILLGFSWRFFMIGPAQPSIGRTWQSKKTMASPTAASPPCFLVRIRPCEVECRKILALCWVKKSAVMPCSMGGFEASSTMMISRSTSAGVAAKIASTVFLTKSPSLAHGSTTESVASSRQRAAEGDLPTAAGAAAAQPASRSPSPRAFNLGSAGARSSQQQRLASRTKAKSSRVTKGNLLTGLASCSRAITAASAQVPRVATKAHPTAGQPQSPNSAASRGGAQKRPARRVNCRTKAAIGSRIANRLRWSCRVAMKATGAIAISGGFA
mmetsp:Transcript_10349/g.36340  ORF Transcript_10349/g.36340 Transcript_10349/m.36340 type:complete len:273 (-) Transcript_10349:289-1107(-)